MSLQQLTQDAFHQLISSPAPILHKVWEEIEDGTKGQLATLLFILANLLTTIIR